MFQSIATRSIIPVGLAVTGFVAIGCLCLYSIMKQDMIDDAAQSGRNIASTVVLSTRYAMLNNDRQHLGQIIANIGQQQGVEHLRVFNHNGFITFSRDQSEIGQQINKNTKGCSGCHTGDKPAAQLATEKQTHRYINERGVKVLAMSQPIYNEPSCSTTVCHYHSENNKVLGMLDIGIDQGPLQNSLALMRYRMIIFTLMTLVLTVGGVAALLNRSFFIPLHKLVSITSATEPCASGKKLESGYGELSLLALNFHNLISRLKETRESLARCRSNDEEKDNPEST
ncbi:MAG: HAMP domain-containing protein [Desulfuromonadaceae bacterium]|nr:HAMP domain-containing protein [Desulfuromonadaceae bacterium]MDD2849469.1 HAMP domain-containing protein [Desulfuromonadaceae bacterium]MDD4130517.1 HAMP domain-containing protein [Desulfuromonadaceae bacterium]